MPPTAQEELARLEKENAPAHAQVQQAAVFAGIDLSVAASDSGDGALNITPGTGYHGRQEYVLRWLLKKWSADGGKGLEARRCANAWRLFTRCLKSVPIRGSAKILQERKFGSLLRKTVDEGAEMTEVEKKEERASKKRRRDGSPVNDLLAVSTDNRELRNEVFGTVASVILLSASSDGVSNGFQVETEYMRSVLRMPAEEAAKVFKSWLKWNLTILRSEPEDQHDWLLHFMKIWSIHVPSSEDVQIFSKHCLKPLLELLAIKQPYTSKLEQLLARNVIIPARADYETTSSTTLLSKLVGDILANEPNFAPTFLACVVRCLVPHGTQRRRPNETSWLQAAFDTIKDSVVALREDQPLESGPLEKLLKVVLDHQVTLDLPLLRSIISQAAFASDVSDWNIIATTIKLDANVFLISEPEVDLLQELLSRITRESTKLQPGQEADKLCSDILVPLMSEFAKARDLSGFVHKWYEQLREAEDLRSGSKVSGLSKSHWRVWEDDRLLHKMTEVMESSLTVSQIVDLMEWLTERLAECSSAVYVIADSIAAATYQDETIDAIGDQLIALSVDKQSYRGFDPRIAARFWNIARNSFRWASQDKTIQHEDLVPLVDIEKERHHHKQLEDSLAHDLVFPAMFKCFCAGWSLGAFEDLTGYLKLWIGKEIKHFQSLIKSSVLVWRSGAKSSQDSYQDLLLVSRCQTSAHTVCVEYPQILTRLITLPDGMQMIKDIIWIASASNPFSQESSPVGWIQENPDMFPSIVRNMFSSEIVLNNTQVIGFLIDTLLECGDHTENPIDKSRACNGFVVNCLLQLPLEVFSRSQRESILKAWPPASPDPAHKDREVLSYKMASLDPAVLSLKAKIMRLPTLYKGIQFQSLVELGESVATLSEEPKILVPIYAELAQRTIGHIIATADQERSLAYSTEMLHFFNEWVKTNQKAKSVLSFAIIRLLQVVATTHGKRAVPFDIASFRSLLLNNLARRLQKPEKLKKDDDERCMSVYSTLDALNAVGVHDTPSALDIESLSIQALRDINPFLGTRLEIFSLEHSSRPAESIPDVLMDGDITSVAGRQFIQKATEIFTKDLPEAAKLRTVASLIHGEFQGVDMLKMLLSLRHVIASCEDSRDTVMDEAGEVPSIDLSSAYSVLAVKLCMVQSSRQACLISEIMEMILRTKSHCISQYNIDSTLSTITTMCSHDAPALPSHRAGTIYLHLARLLHAILTSHRLKLQGRYDALTLTLTSLLRCLFVLISTSTKYANPSPAWIPRPSAPLQQHLAVPHAAAYTRLITLICSPTVSAVSRGSSSMTSLNNPTAKAKRLAAQYMPTVLGAYIKMQLDLNLRMKPEIREALVPAVYAIFDTMNVEERRALGESLDSAGRAVLGTMVRDWSRFGKWQGN